jgi:cytoskeletal protein CcmA (bactofilin family)
MIVPDFPGNAAWPPQERAGSSWHADCYVMMWEVNGMFWSREEERGSYLAKGLRFVGDVLGAGDFVCDGEVEGRIEIDGLVQIDSDGKVHGGIEATEADIAGSVDGDVVTRVRLVLRAPCRLKGDVMSPELVVEPGATILGQIHIAQQETEATVAPENVTLIVS